MASKSYVKSQKGFHCHWVINIGQVRLIMADALLYASFSFQACKKKLSLYLDLSPGFRALAE